MTIKNPTTKAALVRALRLDAITTLVEIASAVCIGILVALMIRGLL